MKFKSQKGSVTVFVLIALLFYTAFLLLMYAANTNKLVATKEKSDILKGIYEKNIDSVSINDLYNKETFFNEENETRTSYSYRYDGKVYFDGTNYIDTGLKLFNPDNVDKDFEINFNIDSLGNNADKSTILNSMKEGDSPWPGFVVRFSGKNNLAFKANCTSEIRKENTYGKNTVNTVKIKRVSGKLYYTINDGEQIELIDYAQLAKPFSTSLVFGCSIDANGSPQRYFKGAISNINVRINTDERYKTLYEHKDRITFDGTNHINTGIKLFNQDNINKDFRIEFVVNRIESNEAQATLLNAKDESGSPWPGICLRYYDINYRYLELSASSTTKKSKEILVSNNNRIIFKRKNKKIYYSINDEYYKEINDFSDIPWLFEVPLTFGCSLDGNGNPFRFFKGTLSEIKVEIEE